MMDCKVKVNELGNVQYNLIKQKEQLEPSYIKTGFLDIGPLLKSRLPAIFNLYEHEMALQIAITGGGGKKL